LKILRILVFICCLFLSGVAAGQEIELPDTSELDPGGRCAFLTARGLWLASQGRNDEAEAAYAQAVKEDSRCAEAYLRMAEIELERGEEYEAETMLSNAARLLPDDHRAALRLAEIYVAGNKPVWALRTLNRIFDKIADESEMARWNYLMALAALQMDDGAGALKYMDAMPRRERKNYRRYYFYRGVALSKQNMQMEARSAFNRYLNSGDDDAAFRKQAEERIDLTYMKGGRPPIFAFKLALITQYDSNVVQEPEDVSLTSDNPGAFAEVLALDMSLNVLRMPRHLLGADMRVLRSFYFSETADDFNLTHVGAEPRYRYLFSGAGFDQQIEAAYSFRLGMLDGGPLVEKDDFYVYSESHAGRFGWRMSEIDFGETYADYQFGGNFYHHLARNALAHRLRIGQSFFFLNNRLKAFAELLARFEDAERGDYDRWGINPFAGVTALLPYDINIQGWVQYEHTDHYDSDSSTVWNKRRRDDEIGAGAGISRSFLGWMEIGLDYNYTRNLSTVELYDYQRHLVSLRLAGFYAW